MILEFLCLLSFAIDKLTINMLYLLYRVFLSKGENMIGFILFIVLLAFCGGVYVQKTYNIIK